MWVNSFEYRFFGQNKFQLIYLGSVHLYVILTGVKTLKLDLFSSVLLYFAKSTVSFVWVVGQTFCFHQICFNPIIGTCYVFSHNLIKYNHSELLKLFFFSCSHCWLLLTFVFNMMILIDQKLKYSQSMTFSRSNLK